MKVMKKKKSDAESQHDDYNEFKSDEDKDDTQYKKEKKERRKKKMSEEGKSKEYNEFESNEGEDDAQSKKRKKKKLSTESKSKEYKVLERNEGEGDVEGKKGKLKKLSEEGKSKKYNEFESNEGEDDALGKKRKKKNLSTESKSKEFKVLERNEGEGEGEGDVEGKKRKLEKLSEEGKSKECNEFENNDGEDDAQGRKRKKKKFKESKSEEYNVFERNEGEGDVKGKKTKKKKLSEEGKSKEYNEFENNEVEDDAQGKKKKLSKESTSEEYNVFERNGGEDYIEGKKRKKKKPSEEGKSMEYNEFQNNEGEDDAKGKKTKKKKPGEEGKSKEYNEFEKNEVEDDAQGKKKKLSKESTSEKYNVFERNEGEDDVEGKKSKKKKKSDDSKSKDKKMMARKKAKAGNDGSLNPSPSGLSKRKRVTFSDEVEVCCDGLVRGKRFTLEEDEMIKQSVFNYIESHDLGDEGLDMVLHCGIHPEVRGCWKEIAAALPHRPLASVYTRAHILFERAEQRKWKPEEFEFLLKVQEQHGANWRQVADALGKNRIHVKDAWRRVRQRKLTKGHWTQEEYQSLFDLVNLDLRVRASQGYRKSKHGMLRENIGWEAISRKLTSRTVVSCCTKWYKNLTSPMVASGGWSDTDDYRLVDALFNLDACCMEEVDWDNLLEHRSGDLCRKRWSEIVRYVGEHGGKSFAEQVELLTKRFCPDLLEVREAFDAKPLIC
ncbi:hypothetical protein PHAVU_007G154900 [Phaseolus vulgaris]|uniref:Uncharacterized protein n=1 Tax=Phaseolus vulgaris TaxID=3885 RepID=V7BEY9_PHAVU|nr:hypothetical protein PHAVU_007G154900g [Phaseolus vulgaris]XP_007144425.1 hypothetical protein PHAVU_007G154900g [Phaseolus vulgaris]ESW16418.1 hypothetical protein PHAVU_007G154900g [Phaseolus vulgaris]ESW16419.1 hypothetical protein PHAVU_007G154900g [Phaseolus vulgaris]